MSWPNADDMEPGDVISILGIDHVFYEDEMRTGGSLSWNNKNHGNIVHFKGEAESYGAYAGKHNDIFAIFPTEGEGYDAVKRFVRRRKNMTILALMKLYAPAGHGPNNPEHYAAQIAAAYGATSDTTVAELGDDELTVFADTITTIEGWKPGSTFTADGLPPDMFHWLSQFPDRASRDAADQPFAKVGSSAEGVKNIQRGLNELGWSPALTVDGIFGQGTAAAARWFQTNNGLTPDGIFGNKSWKALMNA